MTKLKIENYIDVKGRQAGLISNAISEVIQEFTMRCQVKKLKTLRIFVTTNPVEVCRKVITSKVKLSRHSEMREWICENAPSFSYWEEGQIPTIMLDANQKIFEDGNYSAIKGLFAHELMHLMNRLVGIDDDLEIEAEKAGRHIFNYLTRIKDSKTFTTDKLLSSFIRVTASTLFFIKDTLANTRAMSFGFDDELFDNYKETLTGVKKEIKFTERGIIKTLKTGRKHVLDNAFIIYMGLNTSWIPFKMFHNEMYKELKEMAKIEVPAIIKKNCDPILEELLKLRSATDKNQIAKILRLTQQNYFNVVKYYSKKLR
jgi:hypothetical protein